MPSLDPAAITTLRELNPEDPSFLRELIEIYLADSPQRITDLEQALVAGDANRLIRAAHSLKGSSANFGAEHLRSLSEQIESAAKHGTLQEVPAQLPALKAEYAQVKAELEALLPPA